MKRMIPVSLLFILTLVLCACGQQIAVTAIPRGSQSNLAEAASVRVFDLASGENGKAPSVTLNSGYSMPVAGIGTYSLMEDECVNSIVSALQNGVRLIDTAYMYHNEEAVGNGMQESGVPRKEIFLTTKLYPSQFDHAAEAIDEALEKLGTEYIDLMLLHHPGAGDVDAYKAMEQAVADGKIRSIGLSKLEYGFLCVSCA